MLRVLLTSLSVLLLCCASVRADDIKCKVKSVDTDKNTITVTVDDKDKTLPIGKDTKFVHLVGKNLKKAQLEDVTGGLSGVTTGSDVTLTTDKVDGKEMVVQVKVEGLSPKKKKKKNNN